MFRNLRAVFAAVSLMALPGVATAQTDKKVDVTGKWTFTVTTDVTPSLP